MTEKQYILQKVSKLHSFFFQHQFIRYLFIGGSTFVIDLGLLVILHDVLHINVLISASLSYWSSILFNFTMNRLWTFNKKGKDGIEEHILLYALLLGFNYLFTIGFIWVATHAGMHYTLAKVLAVGIQIAWTYIVYKKIFTK